MAIARKIKDVFRVKSSVSASDSGCQILCHRGECTAESAFEFSGVQIRFRGKAQITSALPEGWILRASQGTILIVNLQKQSIKDAVLFTYKGFIKIQSVIVCSPTGALIKSSFEHNLPNWENLEFIFNKETTTFWEGLSDNRRNGFIKKSSVELPLKNNLDAFGDIYYLDDRPYKGKYHLYEDTGVAMTGAFASKKSRILSKEISISPAEKEIEVYKIEEQKQTTQPSKSQEEELSGPGVVEHGPEGPIPVEGLPSIGSGGD